MSIVFSPEPRLALPFDSTLFSPWRDPKSRVVSYLLEGNGPPQKQSFYFVNPSLTRDGRYYWCYASYPPSGNSNQGRMLALTDFETGRLHTFHDSQFTGSSPLVDLRTGEAYWCAGAGIWKRSPQPGSVPVAVNKLPAQLACNRQPRISHLTFSADHRSLAFDTMFGRSSSIGEAPLDGSVSSIWEQLEGCYDHSQFNPVDPDLILFAQDDFPDPLTGQIQKYHNRMWLIRRGEKARPVFDSPIRMDRSVARVNCHYAKDSDEKLSDARAMHGHEWWSADGRWIYYIHYQTGIERVPTTGGTPELVWPHATVSHAHVDAALNWLVLDSLPPEAPDKHYVEFVNLKTRKTIRIVSHLPRPIPEISGYHVHPHPQFCGDGHYICYTTTVRGHMDVAFVPVESLVSETA